MQDIISAIATPAGSGGVAIIRLSGENCLSVARQMFESKLLAYEPNRMYAGHILADGFTDYGFMVYFASPKSFTGEDIVEFHCHGGAELARGVLKKTVMLGARLADRGEFTKRAFLNGKLSLASAEGMADMINAESLALLRAGSMLYLEKLTQKVRSVQDKLKTAIAGVAVEIDYPEEDAGGADMQKLIADITDIYNEITALTATYSTGKKIKNGVSVAICGKPNAGKSSLLNALLGYDKAIVSAEAGTTRDAVEGCLELDGIKYDLVDTAGIRKTSGEVESIGIERAKSIILSADIVILLSDGDDAELPAGISGKIIRVFNKTDIMKPKRGYDISVSAKTGAGVKELKDLLKKHGAGDGAHDKAYIVEERHYNALTRAGEALKSTVDNMCILTADLIAVDLKEAWDALGEITGETASEEIVNTIFAKFCVGK